MMVYCQLGELMSRISEDRRYLRDHARRRLRALAAKHLASGTAELGDMRSLARYCGVSTATMARLIARLEQEGIVLGGRGRRLRLDLERIPAFIDEPADAGRCAPPAVAAWEQVCARLEDDLRGGMFPPPRPLPPLKVLAARYGVCYRTLRRAVDELCRRSVLRREGIHYHAPGGPSPRRRGEVVLIARGQNHVQDDEILLLYERTRVMLSALESACHQAGLRLTTCTVYYEEAEMRYSSGLQEILHDASRREGIVGFVLWTLTIRPTVARRLVEQELLPFGKPIAVFDSEDRALPLSLSGAGQGNLRLFALADQRSAGREVGRFLLGGGHRRVAFVKRGLADYWAGQRLEGLREVFVRGSSPSDVVVVDPTEQSAATDGLPAIARQGWPLPDPAVESQFQAPWHYFAASLMAIQAPLSHRAALYRRLAAMLPDIARRHAISAWVAANDETALVCLDVLRVLGLKPGRDCSLIGFDNTFESSAYRLTSYSFNEPALVSAMVHHLVDRRWLGRYRRSESVFSVPGALVERGTSGRAT